MKAVNNKVSLYLFLLFFFFGMGGGGVKRTKFTYVSFFSIVEVVLHNDILTLNVFRGGWHKKELWSSWITKHSITPLRKSKARMTQHIKFLIACWLASWGVQIIMGTEGNDKGEVCTWAKCPIGAGAMPSSIHTFMILWLGHPFKSAPSGPVVCVFLLSSAVTNHKAFCLPLWVGLEIELLSSLQVTNSISESQVPYCRSFPYLLTPTTVLSTLSSLILIGVKHLSGLQAWQITPFPYWGLLHLFICHACLFVPALGGA